MFATKVFFYFTNIEPDDLSLTSFVLSVKKILRPRSCWPAGISVHQLTVRMPLRWTRINTISSPPLITGAYPYPLATATFSIHTTPSWPTSIPHIIVIIIAIAIIIIIKKSTHTGCHANDPN
ncbi:MAG: hypothetical protein Q8P67_14470 [archaeon]|nr:hypothetical protein [archaeon]